MAILGIDEVGRGPLAGPLVVGAVVLPEPIKLDWVGELRDSKKLSAKKRERLSDLIMKEAYAGFGWVSASELDTVGVSEALRLATRRAVKSVQALHANFSQIVIDGKINFLADTALEKYVSTVVKADDLIKEVSAASIVAKVARDKYMTKVAEVYPGYGFEKNVGYGTAVHMKALKEIGICSEHRRSYEPIATMTGFKKLDNNVVKNTTLIGKRAEEAVCEYLEDEGQFILTRNFRTKYCEIDIVSTSGKYLYFTEVKYRKNDMSGDGLAAITPAKQKQMKFAAEIFLKCHPEYADFNPILAAASVSGNFKVDSWFMIV